MGFLSRLFGQATTDSGYQKHMQPAARRARRRQVDTRPGYSPRLSHQELAELYRNRLVRKIVDVPANAAANKPPQFSGNDKDFWTDLFTRLPIMPAMRGGLRWSGLYGFGAALLDFNDRQQLDQPLRTRQASALIGITPLSRRAIWPDDPMAGPYSEYFQVWGPQRFLARVHRSRLLIFDGEEVDEFERLKNQGCGDSRVDQLNGALSRMFGAHESIAFALQTFSTFLYRVDQLDSLLANDGPRVERKLDAMDEFRHLTRMLTVDKADEVDYKTMNLSGLADSVGVLKEMVAVESGMPQIVVFGSSPTGSGLTNGGLSEMAQFEGFVDQLRSDRVDGNLEYLLQVLSEVYKKQMPGWKLHPALPPDQERLLKMREAQARIDAAYLAMTVYGAQTIQTNRFEGDYSFETTIHPDDLNPEQDVPPTEPQFPPMDDDKPTDQPDQEQDPNAQDPAQ